MIRQFPAPYDSPEGSAEDSPVVQLVYGLLFDCLRRRCEHLHLALSDERASLLPGQISDNVDLVDLEDKEPIETRIFTVREFGNGAWRDLMKPPAQMYPPILQRLKVMASFGLTRRPSIEEGRFRLTIDGSVYEIGVTVRTKPDGSQEAMIDLPSKPV